MNLNPRIAVAFVVGLVMVGGSYLLSAERSREYDHSLTTIVAEEPVRSFIKVSDQDEDGLPDWQNSLNTPTVEVGDEDKDDQEMSRTAAFAVELATRTTMQTTDPAGILADLGANVARSALDTQYDSSNINISADNSPAALRAYGNAVAKIALENSVPAGTEDELTILNRALLRNDETILAGLDPTIASYEKMITAMLATPVPSSFTREHLSLLNVYQAVQNDVIAFRGTFEDALPAMSRFRRYQADAEALYVAVSALYLKLHGSGIEWTEADAASRFIEID